MKIIKQRPAILRRIEAAFVGEGHPDGFAVTTAGGRVWVLSPPVKPWATQPEVPAGANPLDYVQGDVGMINGVFFTLEGREDVCTAPSTWAHLLAVEGGILEF